MFQVRSLPGNWELPKSQVCTHQVSRVSTCSTLPNFLAWLSHPTNRCIVVISQILSKSHRSWSLNFGPPPLGLFYLGCIFHLNRHIKNMAIGCLGIRTVGEHISSLFGHSVLVISINKEIAGSFQLRSEKSG